MKSPNELIPNANYGSIPHLPGSRVGSGDHTISGGQEGIVTGRIVRSKHDVITVTEKLDGSNVSVFRDSENNLIPLQRKGYPAISSPWEQHRMFHDWVMVNQKLFDFLEKGQRVCGEWLAQAHGSLYNLGNRCPFVVFDLREDKIRIPYSEWSYFVKSNLPLAPLLGTGCMTTVEALDRTKVSLYGAVGPAEGAVYRVDTIRNKVLVHDYICKIVRTDKEDGKYLMGCNPDITEDIWNWHFDSSRIWTNKGIKIK